MLLMTEAKHISISILGLIVSILLLWPTAANAQLRRKKIIVQPDTVPLLNGFAVSADIMGPIQRAISDYGQYEAALRLNLKDYYFPVIELGLGSCNHVDGATEVSYKTRAPYGRAGIDFNLMKDKHDIYRLYGGIRYAFTSFKFDIGSMGVTDPVWGDHAAYEAEDVKASYQWLELVFGVDATIWGPFHMGWSVRYRNRLFYNIDDMDNCWYVPGYGKHGRSRIGATFNLIFDI